MGYSNYKKLKQVTKKFGLDARFTNIFPPIEPQPIGSWLAESLEMAEIMPLTNEKNKSERLVSPILLDIVKHFRTQITLFSGEDLPVNPSEDLAGECDFFFALHAPKPYIDFPIISSIQTRGEDRDHRLAQCAAQIYAASLYNKTYTSTEIPIFGCSITNSEWQFFKFENNTFYIDKKPMSNLLQVLGNWHWILNYYVTNFGNL